MLYQILYKDESITLFTCDQDVPENPETRHIGVIPGLDSLSAGKLEYTC